MRTTGSGTASGKRNAKAQRRKSAKEISSVLTCASLSLRKRTDVRRGGFVRSGTNVFLNDIDFALPGRGPINIRPLLAGTAITALGYWNTGGDDTTFLRFYDANNMLIEQVESITGGGNFNFNGIVSAIPAFRVEIARGTLGNGYFTLDDLQLTVARVGVPEPGTLLLVICGFLAARRRRSRKS